MLKQTIDIARFEYAGAWFHKHLIELMRGHVLVRVLQKTKRINTLEKLEGKTHRTDTTEIHLPPLFKSLQRRNFDALNAVNKAKEQIQQENSNT